MTTNRKTAGAWSARVFLLGLLALLALPAPLAAAADFEIEAFDAPVLNADGTTTTQAGSHPYETRNKIQLKHGAIGDATPPLEPSRTLRVDLPAGFIGNPNATPKCPFAELTNHSAGDTYCKANTQVGVIGINWGGPLPEFKRLFNLEPPPGAAAAFGFSFVDVPVVLLAKLRNGGDYGVSIEAFEISQAIPFSISDARVWGVPADSSHDIYRGICLFEEGSVGTTDPGSDCTDGTMSPIPAGITPKPFLRNPTSCTPGLETKLWAESWRGSIGEASFLSEEGITGCDALRFDPEVEMRTTSTQPDSPTGLEVELSVPQDDNVTGLAQADLRDAVVALPEGMSISPSSADGLSACADEQLKLGSAEPAACPDGSKIGSVRVDTPLLEEPVEGGVYIRSQNSDDPGSGEMFRLAIELRDDERGIDVKLPGQVRLNAETGRVETTFANSPQLPFSKLTMKLKGGPRAPLAMPATCGTKTIEMDLASWAGHDVELTDSFEVACPGVSGFAPAFEAGALDPFAGAFSPFTALIDRDDRQQYLAGIEMDMPKGFLAKLRGVDLCPDAVAADGTPGLCPPGSKIGTATVGAGPGSSPFFVTGNVHLTGPYKGGPYGLSVQVHAKAGPYDLGWVKVRNALYVDPETAQVSVVSDRLPQIVKGVPVRLRSVDVDVDRPGFAVNPTSCSAKRVDAALTSADGAIHAADQGFRVGDCAGLAFKPKLAMRLSGRKQTRTGGHPGLKAVLTQGKGQANIAQAKVTLPRSVVLDAANSADPALVCDYDKSLKADCPASSVIGKATASTPLLNKPLTGNVHLVQGIKFGPTGNRIRTTPALLVKLRGEVAINLRAKTTTEKGTNRLVTTFPAVPDAPVSKFTLQINGGNNGILVVTRTAKRKLNLCAASQIASVETDGHNTKHADYDTKIKTPCEKAKRAKNKKK